MVALEANMQVFKLDSGLAVQLPAHLVDALGLNPGDELAIVAVGGGRIELEKVDKRAAFLQKMERFRVPLSEGYRFDRDEANER
jgi:antitoxin MazE